MRPHKLSISTLQKNSIYEAEMISLKTFPQRSEYHLSL